MSDTPHRYTAELALLAPGAPSTASLTQLLAALRQQRELASALRVLSAEFRNERMMRAEEKAARLPAIMTVPLILFILPVLFVVILGPAAIQVMKMN